MIDINLLIQLRYESYFDFLVALLPLCGFANPVEAEPLDVILSNSLSRNA